ncbi:MAG TPA: GTP-sensing pleiotropic transcriptional regulator CodY [Syntrophaceticus sp.]|nr:GTP-sensing pleiotropic transcriptional regulator CodY [Syntrophaceticus sp.]
MESLMDKMYAVKSYHEVNEGSRDFAKIAQIIGQNINANANVYLVGRRGKILGYHLTDDSSCSKMHEVIDFSQRFPESYNQKLLLVKETEKNSMDVGNFCFFSPIECPLQERCVTIIPIFAGGDRLGTMVFSSAIKGLSDQDLVLAEFGAMVAGIEIMCLITERAESDHTRNKATVQIALSTLSYSEISAVGHIFSELGGTEGLVVASRVADRVGITRSVIVNALRKLESANVIQSKSLGMKGTYIRILNENLLDELKKLGQ